MFALPEDDYLDYNFTVDFGTEAPPPQLLTVEPTLDPTPESTVGPEEMPTEMPITTDSWFEEEKPEELCSKKPFNAFTDLKNGSLYAFRGTLETFPWRVGHAAMSSAHAGDWCLLQLPLLSFPREVLL